MPQPLNMEKLGAAPKGRRAGRWPWAGRVTALDLDGDMLRVVQAVRRGGRARIVRYAASRIEGFDPAASPAERGRAVGETLRRLGVRARRVVLGIPRAQVMLRTLSLPPAEQPGEVAAMVHYQLARDLPFPAAEAIIDFTLQPVAGGPPTIEGESPALSEEGENALRVLAAVVKRELVRDYEELARAAGLKLAALGLRSHANVRCVELRRLEGGDRCVAMVSLRSDEVIFDVVLDGSLAFSRVGSVTLQAEPGDETGRRRMIADIVLEVVRGVHNYEGVEGHGAITRFFVAGCTGLEEELKEALRERFDVPAEVLDPVRLLGLKRIEGNGATGAQAAFGLALGALDPEGLPFDFLHPRRPPVRRDTRRLRVLAAATAGACLLFGLTVWRTVLVRRHQAVLAALQQELALANRNARAYRALSVQAATVRQWEQSRTPWLDHLALLSALLPPSPDLYVTSLSASGGNTLNLSVKVRTGEILNRIGDALREAGYEVKPSAITPVNDRYGYRFQAGLELAIPAGMSIDLARLEVPERPADDVSGSAELALETPVNEGTPAPAAASDSHAANSSPGAREVAGQTSPPPGTREKRNRFPGDGSAGNPTSRRYIEVKPSYRVVEPTPIGRSRGQDYREARRNGVPRVKPAPAGGSERRRFSLPENWSRLSPEERRALIERFRQQRERSRSAVSGQRKGGGR
ncbi:MAG: hypothetical protein D6766_10740 [Verrucomicrobia bacterium]|nr:MAG: hypothetical protein D6766_10740 [Verrucomicrobiota bacterium]